MQVAVKVWVTEKRSLLKEAETESRFSAYVNRVLNTISS